MWVIILLIAAVIWYYNLGAVVPCFIALGQMLKECSPGQVDLDAGVKEVQRILAANTLERSADIFVKSYSLMTLRRRVGQRPLVMHLKVVVGSTLTMKRRCLAGIYAWSSCQLPWEGARREKNCRRL